MRQKAGAGGGVLHRGRHPVQLGRGVRPGPGPGRAARCGWAACGSRHGSRPPGVRRSREPGRLCAVRRGPGGRRRRRRSSARLPAVRTTAGRTSPVSRSTALAVPRTVSTVPPRPGRYVAMDQAGPVVRLCARSACAAADRAAASPRSRRFAAPVVVETDEADAVTEFRRVSRSPRAASSSLRAYRPVTTSQHEPARKVAAVAHISGLARR